MGDKGEKGREVRRRGKNRTCRNTSCQLASFIHLCRKQVWRPRTTRVSSDLGREAPPHLVCLPGGLLVLPRVLPGDGEQDGYFRHVESPLSRPHHSLRERRHRLLRVSEPIQSAGLGKANQAERLIDWAERYTRQMMMIAPGNAYLWLVS